jgi:hypothetical protein
MLQKRIQSLHTRLTNFVKYHVLRCNLYWFYNNICNETNYNFEIHSW